MEFVDHLRIYLIFVVVVVVGVVVFPVGVLVVFIDFIPNAGWLHRFKGRHNIRQHKISGESDSVKTLETQVWLDKVFPSLIDGYHPSCIYNADETGLFYKMLHQSTP